MNIPRLVGKRLSAAIGILLAVGLFGAGWALWAPPLGAEDLPVPQWVGAADRKGKVVLTWVRDPRLSLVRIYRASPETRDAFLPIGVSPDNRFTDASAAPGRTYRYRLAAIGPDGKEGKPSVEVSVQRSSRTLNPPVPPVWEGHLALAEGIGLKWGRQDEADVIAYNIYRATSPETEFRLVASVLGTSHVDTGLEPGRLYVYVLTALDSAFKETPFSAELPVAFEPPAPTVARDAPAWRPRRSRLVALVSAGDQPFLRPADVVVGPLSGNVYLADSGNNRISVFTPVGDFVRSLGPPPDASDAFRRLLGLGVDAGENLCAVDSARGSVFTFTAKGAVGKRIEPRQPVPPPYGLIDCAPRADGGLYLVDNTGNRVVLVGREEAPRAFGALGYRGGEFSAPSFCATDGGGSLYVSDTLNGRVQIFSPAGEFVRAFGVSKRGPGGMPRPKGIAVSAAGEIFVADSLQNTIQIFDGSGQMVALLVDEKGEALDLGSPNGIALGQGNRIYIAERLGARLQIREILQDAP